jgi:hypothetical protein
MPCKCACFVKPIYLLIYCSHTTLNISYMNLSSGDTVIVQVQVPSRFIVVNRQISAVDYAYTTYFKIGNLLWESKKKKKSNFSFIPLFVRWFVHS